MYGNGNFNFVVSKRAESISDFFNGSARNLFVVDFGGGGNLAHNQKTVVRRTALDGTAGKGVGGKVCVNARVGYGVAQLVGMTFGYAFTGKKLFHKIPLSLCFADVRFGLRAGN